MSTERTRRSGVRRAPEGVERALSDGLWGGRLAGFELGEELGRGAMGSVRRAHDPLLGRSVAVKVLSDPGDGLIRRFVVEAQLGAQLEHPNIVPFYEFLATPEGRPAFSMKLVEGETLASYLSTCGESQARSLQAPYDLMSRLDRFLKICDAVDYAHARGVVHRDLKPGNVMLGLYNEVYVMDWGIARVLDGDGEGADARAPSNPPVPRAPGLTEDGEVVGTPQYMAPEQARAEPVTTAADEYALGMILAEIITLESPRRGSTNQELTDAVLGRPPRLEPRFDGPLPRELVAVVRKATAALPGQRYASVLDLAADVRRFMRDEPVTVLNDGFWRAVWRRLKRRPMVVLVVIAACLLFSASLLVVGLVRELNARALVAAQAERIFALTMAVDRTARALDARLGRVELLLEGLAEAATEVARQPAGSALAALAPADVAAQQNPTHVARYGQKVSFERSAFVRSPDVSPESIQPVLDRLAALEPLMVRTAARAAAGDEALHYEAGRQRAVAREGGTILWTDLAFESGLLLVYPGNTHFPADFDVRRRSWYAAARAQPGPVWGSPYPDATSGSLIIACARALGGNSALDGVAALHMRLEDVLGALRVLDVEGYRNSALLDGSGNVVLSEATRELRLGPGTHQNRAVERLPFDVQEVRDAVISGQGNGRARSGERLVVFQRLESEGWYVVVEVEAAPYGLE